MDTQVSAALTSLAATIKSDAIETYVFVLPIVFGVFVAIWAIRFGYGKLIGALHGRA